MASDAHTAAFHRDAPHAKGRGVAPTLTHTHTSLCVRARLRVFVGLFVRAQSQLLFVSVSVQGQCHDGVKGTERRSKPENPRNLSRRQGTNRESEGLSLARHKHLPTASAVSITVYWKTKALLETLDLRSPSDSAARP